MCLRVQWTFPTYRQELKVFILSLLFLTIGISYITLLLYVWQQSASLLQLTVCVLKRENLEDLIYSQKEIWNGYWMWIPWGFIQWLITSTNFFYIIWTVWFFFVILCYLLFPLQHYFAWIDSSPKVSNVTQFTDVFSSSIIPPPTLLSSSSSSSSSTNHPSLSPFQEHHPLQAIDENIPISLARTQSRSLSHSTHPRNNNSTAIVPIRRRVTNSSQVDQGEWLN